MAKSQNEIQRIATEVAAQLAATASKAASNLATNNPDHDVLNTLVGAVANLDKNFTERFAEVRNDIQKLSDGTGRQIADHELRIGKLETAKTTQNTMMSIGIGLLTLLASLLIYHLV